MQVSTGIARRFVQCRAINSSHVLICGIPGHRIVGTRATGTASVFGGKHLGAGMVELGSIAKPLVTGVGESLTATRWPTL